MILRSLGFFLILVLLTSNITSADVTIDSRTNQERTSRGLTTLTTDGTLASIAAQRAVQIASTWSHAQWIYTAMGCIKWGGENLAYSDEPNNDFVADWMNSAGHRANILNGSFDQQGSAVYVSPTGRVFAVQVFKDSCDSTGDNRNPTDTSESTPPTSGASQGTEPVIQDPSTPAGTPPVQLPDTAIQQGG